MKSTKRSLKAVKQQSKSNTPQPQTNLNLIATDEPVEQHQVKFEMIPTSVDEPPQQELKSCTIADPDEASTQKSKPQRSHESRRVKPELSGERFQHIRFIDCDKAVRRVIKPPLGEGAAPSSVLETTTNTSSGVIIECFREGNKLRVRVVSDGYNHNWKVQFPKDIRVEGARYLVQEIRESASGGFYRAYGDIQKLV
ncbi:hypothetical protein [uncultured Nostoc sp.]|uniref:hypothetical protein n=1 Tax=uncultured Nostoc sp. TaxID=340711 RepID=UPI0035CC3E6A